MQIMPFDGGMFLMCSGYNRRIKRRRPGLILLGEKLSSVITSSLHVVGRGVNSGRGLKKTVQSELQRLAPYCAMGPADHSLKVCDLPLVLLVFLSSLSPSEPK